MVHRSRRRPNAKGRVVKRKRRAQRRHARGLAARQRGRRDAGSTCRSSPAATRGRSRWSASRSPSRATTSSRSSRCALGQSLLDKRAPMYVRTGVLVTNLGVHFKLGRENSVVWVTTLDRGKPVEGAEVVVNDCNGKPLWSGTHRRQGPGRRRPRARRRTPSTAPPTAATSSARARPTRKGGATDVAFVFSSWQKGIEPWRFNVPTGRGAEPDLRASTVFDRTLFRAGETVSMKHFVRVETLARPGAGAGRAAADARQDRPPGQRPGVRPAADVGRRRPQRRSRPGTSRPPPSSASTRSCSSASRRPAQRRERRRRRRRASAPGRAAASASRSSACRWSTRASRGPKAPQVARDERRRRRADELLLRRRDGVGAAARVGAAEDALARLRRLRRVQLRAARAIRSRPSRKRPRATRASATRAAATAS